MSPLCLHKNHCATDSLWETRIANHSECPMGDAAKVAAPGTIAVFGSADNCYHCRGKQRFLLFLEKGDMVLNGIWPTKFLSLCTKEVTARSLPGGPAVGWGRVRSEWGRVNEATLQLRVSTDSGRLQRVWQLFRNGTSELCVNTWSCLCSPCHTENSPTQCFRMLAKHWNHTRPTQPSGPLQDSPWEDGAEKDFAGMIDSCPQEHAVC